MLAPLANRTFRHLFAAQVTSLVGTGLTTVALALLAYDLAGGDAGLVLGLMLALKMVIYVALAPVIGAAVARFDRRRMLVVLDIARAAIVLGLPFVTEIWQVYALFLALHLCAAGFTPAFQATVPDVLPDTEEYTRALALSRLAYDIENLASPGLAAVALTVLSYDALFAANAATFCLSALLIVSCRLPRPAAQQARRFRDRATQGLRVFLATPRLRGLFALYFAVSAGGAMAIVNTVVLVRDRLGGGESDVAVLMAVLGGGSMLAALALPRLLEHVSERRVMLTGGALMVGALLAGLAGSGFAVLAAIWAVIGFAGSLIGTPAGRVITRSSDEESRPAVFTAQFALSHACWLVAYPLAGLLGRLDESWIAFAVLAALAAAGTAAAAAFWPSEDRSSLTHDHPEQHHTHEHVHDAHHQHDHEGWEGPEPHSHPHRHGPLRHAHAFVIDDHHPAWPRG
ncbi:MFS transporter [Thalassobaculum sp. OXR-137]|uniref:MFS transporter n=1 Tax=Thalassobaculum sp. OXR-137 TaxID=3100173 RepID=UPI002AC8D412|nr:MFS transporter [Thalassobaculum sp. OXR-137]WPZ37048.1 MFS transporter [Thalassobaculum sp. OXR-137]